MPETLASSPHGLARVYAWPRVRFVMLVAVGYGLLRFNSDVAAPIWMARTFIVGMLALLPFGVFETRPRHLPAWLPRWPLQVLGVLIVIPFATMIAFTIVRHGAAGTMGESAQRAAFYSLLGPAMLLGPWIAVGALVRQREALARHQALTFQLERSELERKALDARMSLLQAQVQPHFLFNTLANVRALAKAGSPQAPAVLDSLIAYLRAAVPSIRESQSTVAREVELVRAYLDLMHMRMPDRLQFSVHADDAALGLRCPPVSLLTLVENAVRHGIDPSEEGGRIDVTVTVREGRCIARVVDTGVGLSESGARHGTGLDTLRERLQLAFGDAQLRLSAATPHGACAEIEFPAKEASPA